MVFTLLTVTYCIPFYYWAEYSSFIAKAINKTPLTFLVLLGSFWWVRDLFRSDEIQNLWQYPTFYFVSAFYIYYLVTMLLFLMGSFIFDSDLYFYDFAIVNILATLILTNTFNYRRMENETGLKIFFWIVTAIMLFSVFTVLLVVTLHNRRTYRMKQKESRTLMSATFEAERMERKG